MPTESAPRILRLNAVLERTGLSRSTLYRKMHERTFPRAMRISARCMGWRESDVNAWLQNPEAYLLRPAPDTFAIGRNCTRRASELTTGPAIPIERPQTDRE